jgi:hypothetical protein
VPEIGRRVIVIGNTSTGKSTLAAELARRLDVPFVELDALHWEPNWVEAPADVMRERVLAATAGDAWAIAGNYLGPTQEVTWPRAQTIVFLDYPLTTVLRRLVRRTWKRWREHELLWGTNREKFFRHFRIWNQEDSLIAFAVRQHYPKRRRYRALMADPQWSHVSFVHHRAPAETERWLAAVVPPVPKTP